MNNASLRRALVAAGACVALLAGPMAMPSFGGAIVLHDDQCFADPGDIPGLPGFPVANSTVTILPEEAGFIVVKCQGALPAGLTLDETFQGDVTCNGDDGIVATGHIVATRSGRVSLQCRIPV